MRHGFSTRHGGVSRAYGGGALNLGFTAEDSREAVEQNRRIFLRGIGTAGENGEPWPLVAMRQVHSSIVHRIEDLPEHPVAGDGLVTNQPETVLSVRTADCFPVLLADPVQRVIAALHAGWRGTLTRIVEKGVGDMRRWFGSDPADIRAAIGPGIHRCCYQVSSDMRGKFASQFAYGDELFEEVFSSDPVRERYPLLFLNMRPPGHGEPPHMPHLDLVEANRRQLVDAGIAETHMWISDLCTSCRNDLLFSHRKDKGVTGRLMSAIAIAS